MYNEREHLALIKRLELRLLLEIKKVCSQSPANAKAAFNLNEEQIELFNNISETNVMLLVNDGNNKPLFQGLDEQILQQLGSESLDINEFEICVDLSKG